MKDYLKLFYQRIVPWENNNRKIYRLYDKMRKAEQRSKKKTARYYCYLLERRYRCRISPGAKIGYDFSLPHPESVVIGEKCKIGKGVTIYQQVTIGQNHGKYPTVGDNVIIYAGAKVFGDITIGNNSIIGANSVVTKDVPENSIWGGIPAREIKKRNLKEKYT